MFLDAFHVNELSTLTIQLCSIATVVMVYFSRFEFFIDFQFDIFDPVRVIWIPFPRERASGPFVEIQICIAI